MDVWRDAGRKVQAMQFEGSLEAMAPTQRFEELAEKVVLKKERVLKELDGQKRA